MTKKNAYIITNPLIAANRSTEVTLSKFLRVIGPSFGHLSVIGGNLSLEPDQDGVELCSFDITRAGNKLKRAADILMLQLRMSVTVLRRVRKNDTVFFWIGDKMLLPYLAAKAKGAQVNYFIYGNVEKEGSPSVFRWLSAKLIRYMVGHADYACMESTSVLSQWPGLKVRACRVIHLYTEGIGLNPIENREKTIGMVCRLTEGKHVLECIQAMARVHEDHPEWNLEIIGSGRQQQDCEMLISRLNAGAYISLLGWVEHDELAERTRKWSYLLFPTDTEGMPNGLLEMMGRGIPALASPAGGVRDILQDGSNGFTLADTTSDEICNGIYRMLNVSEADYETYCLNAYQSILQRFTLEHAIENAQELLQG